MNFKKNSDEKIYGNKIFTLIKNVLNISNNDGENVNPSYHSIIIAADSDTDGFHICSLIINMFDTFWPKIIIKNYLKILITSVVRVYSKK